MGEHGHPYARFRRAPASGNLLLARAAARELPTLDLADTLALCLLGVDERDWYERAATRFAGRYLLELPNVRLEEAQLLVAALAALSGPAHAAALAMLERLLVAHGIWLVTVTARAQR